MIAKFKHFEPAETFRDLADIAKERGGEWVSAGKESHFRFKKPESKILALIDECRRVLDKLEEAAKEVH